MKIFLAIPGHLKSVPMKVFCEEALRNLGHKVWIFDYQNTVWDRLLRETSRLFRRATYEAHPHMNHRLRQQIANCQPDVFLTIFGFDISRESLKFIRARHIPTACWWLNDPFQFERGLQKAPDYDFFFTNSAFSVEHYHQKGAAQARYLPVACHPPVHRTVPADPAFQCDVLFAGDWSPLRQQAMESLHQHFQIKIFGPWMKKLPAHSPLKAVLKEGFFTPAEMTRMFCSAKVVMNLHTWFGKFDHGTNPRLFEAAGCGAFQVVDWKRDIPMLFNCETEMCCFRSLDELVPLIQTMLAQEETRKNMQAQAQKRALADHTYEKRMAELLRTVVSRST